MELYYIVGIAPAVQVYSSEFWRKCRNNESRTKYQINGVWYNCCSSLVTGFTMFQIIYTITLTMKGLMNYSCYSSKY
jgi:hypothetical protein